MLRATVNNAAADMPLAAPNYLFHAASHKSTADTLHASPACMQILEHLLAAMHMKAHLSLPAVLHLTAVLARDLQHEYLAFFPRVMAAVRGLGIRCTYHGPLPECAALRVKSNTVRKVANAAPFNSLCNMFFPNR